MLYAWWYISDHRKVKLVNMPQHQEQRTYIHAVAFSISLTLYTVLYWHESSRVLIVFVFKSLHIALVITASRVIMQKYIDMFYIESPTSSVRNISD